MQKHILSRPISDNSEPASILSRRDFLTAATALLVQFGLPNISFAGGGEHGSGGSGQRAVVVIFGGVRRAETFSHEGIENIPRLSRDLLPQSLMFADVRNEGVTAHFNAISSIATGNWQRVDDWGKFPKLNSRRSGW